MNTKKASVNTSTKKKNTPENKIENNANTGVNSENKIANIANTDVNSENKIVNIANTDANSVNTGANNTNTDPNEPANTQSLQANTTNTDNYLDLSKGLQPHNTDIGHTEFKKGLQETLSTCQLSSRVNQVDFDWWTEFKSKHETASKAFSELVKLAQKAPETIEVQKPIEVIKEVPIKLPPLHKIVKFDKETADKISFCRPSIARGDVLNYERGNDESFISALVNLSVNKTLDRNFPTIIRLMNLKLSKQNE